MSQNFNVNFSSGPNTSGSDTRVNSNIIKDREVIGYTRDLLRQEMGLGQRILDNRKLQFLLSLVAATIGDNVLHYGDYGRGKTDALNFLVKRFATEEEVAEINGGFTQTAANATGGSYVGNHYVPGLINNNTRIVKIDEASTVNPDAINAFTRMIGSNKLEQKRVPIEGSDRYIEAKFQVFATANPRNNGDGNIRLSDAFLSRFALVNFNASYSDDIYRKIYKRTLSDDDLIIPTRSQEDRQRVELFQDNLPKYALNYLPETDKEKFMAYIERLNQRLDDYKTPLVERTVFKIGRAYNAFALLGSSEYSEYSPAQLAVALYAGVSLTDEQIEDLVLRRK
jgi:Cdc6-like AAA superfamily ATPase